MNRILAYVGAAFDALLRNTTRSILTILGMTIGVAAVTSVYGLSVGATKAINSTVSTSTFPNLTIVADPKQANPAQAQLRFRDANVLMASSGGTIANVTPFYSAFASFVNPRRYQLRYQAQKQRAFGFSWYGGDPKMLVLAGRAFTPADQASAAQVCMISHDLAFQFFGGDQAALGQYVTVNGARFRVVGIPDTNNGTASNYFGGTYFFVLPFTTYHNFAPGNVDGIYVWLNSPDDEDTATAAITTALQHLHGAASKYDIQSTRKQLEQNDKVLNVIAASLTAIGAISLLVAGIGIMNIMLVSVAERTREIGIRKSIGASRGDIVLQFLMEAILLSVAGGFLGLLFSFLIIAGAGSAMVRFTGRPEVPYLAVILAGALFSLGVGAVFGTYPALRASTLDPVEALRS